MALTFSVDLDLQLLENNARNHFLGLKLLEKMVLYFFLRQFVKKLYYKMGMYGN